MVVKNYSEDLKHLLKSARKSRIRPVDLSSAIVADAHIFIKMSFSPQNPSGKQEECCLHFCKEWFWLQSSARKPRCIDLIFGSLAGSTIFVQATFLTTSDSGGALLGLLPNWVNCLDSRTRDIASFSHQSAIYFTRCTAGFYSYFSHQACFSSWVPWK